MLAALGVSIALATVQLDLHHRQPATGQGLDTVAAVYAALSLLFLNAPYALPADPLSRLVYFAVPFLGLVVAGQVLLRLSGLGRVGFRVVR